MKRNNFNWKYISEIKELDFPDHNIALCGRRDTGKSTYLFRYFWKYVEIFSGKIIVIDSATEHKEKSLIRKIAMSYDDYILVDSSKKDFEDLLLQNGLSKEPSIHKLLHSNEHKVILIDVSFYLEKSYHFNDTKTRLEVRERYKIFTNACLTALERMEKNFLIFMDEIELTPQAAKSVNRMSEKNNYTIASIHDISYVMGVKNIDVINVDLLSLTYNHALLKQKDQLCGNACAEIACMLFYEKDGSTKETLLWCSDIALFLHSRKIDVQLLCWNSNLYRDYCSSDDSSFEGFCSLKSYESCVEPIQEKLLCIQSLYREINENRCIVCCVDSSIFNNNEKLSGGHFVVLFKKEEIYYCLNLK